MNRAPAQRAFTLVELLVVIAVISILVAILLPALSTSKDKGRSTACRNNLFNLELAWTIYADDHGDAMCPNMSRAVPPPPAYWVSLPGSWVLGNAQVDSSPANIENGVLFPYVRSTGVYKCQADLSLTTGTLQVPRYRSYMLNLFLDGVPDSAHVGSDGARIKTKVAQVLQPSPAAVFGFLDVIEWEITSGDFYVTTPGGPNGDLTWGDVPADRHSGGANLSFLDGHVEPHRWRYHRGNWGAAVQQATNNADLQDLLWLQARIPGL
jgi:prepilin-type N-terminal cleavage/methylation domain-containing protein/prepilin-type processing-associated H-X9-DG protein